MKFVVLILRRDEVKNDSCRCKSISAFTPKEADRTQVKRLLFSNKGFIESQTFMMCQGVST